MVYLMQSYTIPGTKCNERSEFIYFFDLYVKVLPQMPEIRF